MHKIRFVFRQEGKIKKKKGGGVDLMIVNFEIGEPPRHMYYLFLLDYRTIGKERTFKDSVGFKRHFAWFFLAHEQLGLQHVSYSPIFSRSKHYLEFTYQKNE